MRALPVADPDFPDTRSPFRVAVVEDGRVTELGPHEELVAERWAYAALRDSWYSLPEPAKR